MYGVDWDRETGGILLRDAGGGTVDGQVRPVYFEELDLLGLDSHWKYGRGKAPLLWADGRRYYYRGEAVLDVKGGGFFESPEIVVLKEPLTLEPIDVDGMVQRNAGLLEGLEFRAVEFVRKQYERLRSHVDIAAVAFSGGKDSLVTLDLTQRALAPDEFVVVFDDTTMELSTTYEAYKRAKRHWPSLTFTEAKCHMRAAETWAAFGPPSRMHRWCCAVHKSAPTVLLLRSLLGQAEARVLIVDGVRRNESQRRSRYQPSTVGGKHATQINISPLLQWTSAEVLLYLLARRLESLLNEGYRVGLPRIGCVLCPFSSSWSEVVIWKRFFDDAAPLMQHLRTYSEHEAGGGEMAEAYVREGRWKMRSGGRSVSGGANKVLGAELPDQMSFQIRQPTEAWEEWARTVGTLVREGTDKGSIVRDGQRFPYTIERHAGGIEVVVRGTERGDRFLRRDLRSVAYKSAYCVRCRVCEAECATGALSMDGKVRIDETKCKHCGRCLSHVERGCWVAKSLAVTTRGQGMKGVNTYQTFGMSSEWLGEYFRDPDGWWHSNPRGPRQFEAMKVWLQQAEIVDGRQTRITALGKKLLERGVRDWLCWAVIWTNLAQNSVLVKWYVQSVPVGRPHTKRDLVDLMGDSLAERTRVNAVRSLIRLLRETPLGEEMGLGRIVATAGDKALAIVKEGTRGLPQLAYLYSLYRYAEQTGRYSFSLEELATSSCRGPFALFGVTRDEFVSNLRGLTAGWSEWIRAELVRDLDNIYLDRGHSSLEVLGAR